MENLELYNKLKTPPKDALKTIQAGRLKGKYDISPQWRYEKLTEVLGPCGIGWGYNIIKMWTETSGEGQIFAFTQIDFWYLIDGKRSENIPAVGGSMVVQREKSGLYCNDEAYKMSVTDALGTAMKMIGLAADVYRGLCDGKYRTEVQPEQKNYANTEPQKPQKTEGKIQITKQLFNKIIERIPGEPDLKKFYENICKAYAFTDEQFKQINDLITETIVKNGKNN